MAGVRPESDPSTPVGMANKKYEKPRRTCKFGVWGTRFLHTLQPL